MLNINGTVTQKFGQLMMSICEAEALLAEKDAQIKSLQDELEKLKQATQNEDESQSGGEVVF